MAKAKKQLSKKQLEAQIRDLREQLWDIEEAEWQEKNAPLVGRYFKYRNSYGGSGESWWLYRRVMELGAGQNLKVFQFQLTSDNKVEIELETIGQHYSGWIEIDPADFWKEWAMFLSIVTGQAAVSSGD